MWLEIVGILASVLIVSSMVFKTTSYKGTIAMRSINLVGSVVFVVYGIMLPAYATAIANACLIFINLFYLLKEIRDHNKNKEPSK